MVHIKDLLEIIGDALIIALGIILIYVFTCIEILGYYGAEQNTIIRIAELYGGIPIILFGLYHIVNDVKGILKNGIHCRRKD